MKRPTAWLLILLALATAPSMAAGDRVVTIDPEASRVSFVLDATAHQVHGAFTLRSGEIRWDPETGTASGTIAVDATSAETGNARRDGKMHGEVLESETFPSIAFDVERVEGEIVEGESSDVRLIGTLSLHGDEHPLTLAAVVAAEGERVEATTSFEIPYVDWGLDDPSVFVLRVAKIVTVTVEIRGKIGTGER